MLQGKCCNHTIITVGGVVRPGHINSTGGGTNIISYQHFSLMSQSNACREEIGAGVTRNGPLKGCKLQDEGSQYDGWLAWIMELRFYSNHTNVIYHIEFETFMKRNCSKVIAHTALALATINH